jgi:hypothetical protein
MLLFPREEIMPRLILRTFFFRALVGARRGVRVDVGRPPPILRPSAREESKSRGYRYSGQLGTDKCRLEPP